jgi:hypothetical protein
MITLEKVFEKSKTHPTGDGKQTIFETEKHTISIVGGRMGLYGDFVNEFEVAIIDKETKEFVSGKFFPELSDSTGQVMAYITKEQMLEVVNKMVV